MQRNPPAIVREKKLVADVRPQEKKGRHMLLYYLGEERTRYIVALLGLADAAGRKDKPRDAP